MKPKIKLLLVDDHTLFRESLSRLLEAEPDLELAGGFSTVASGLAAVKTLRVDVVLLDFDLGNQCGLDFLAGLRQQKFPGKTLVVTAGMSDADTVQALALGAGGIFLKHNQPSELLTAIRKVFQGETWLHPAALRTVVAAATTPAQPGHRQPFSLSPRERSALQAVFEGLTNKEIAQRLDISESYVKALLQQLFDKTGVRSRSQLVRIALENREKFGLRDDTS